MESRTPPQYPSAPPIAYRMPDTDAPGPPLSGSQLSMLALRLFAFYVWSLSAGWLASTMAYSRWSAFALTRDPAPYIFVLYAGLGAVIWLLAGKLSHRMIGEAPDTAAPKLQGSQIQSIAISVLGVYFFCGAIPLILVSLAEHIMEKSSQTLTLSSAPLVSRSVLYRHVIELIIGILLFFQAKGLSRFWHNLRGQTPPPG